MFSQVPDHVLKTLTHLPTVTNSMKHTMTLFFVPHTHTHLFPFPLRQLCQTVISTCGQLKASLSWLTGSQFVSYKHRTHLNPSAFTYPSNRSQCVLTPDTTVLSCGKINLTSRILQVVLVFRLLGGGGG